jgi:exodeoxyribonuclease III
MNIVSWNVNGLRAVHRKGSWDIFFKTGADIVCLQEVKARAEQLPAELTAIPGYSGYFNAPTEKKGYSGVAILSKETPKTIGTGLDIHAYDQEGRVLVAEYDDFTLLNVYFPNGGGGPIRLAYKLEFYDAFLAYIEKLRASGKSIIFCGDVNTAHEEIDLARPKENQEHTGFLPEERAWLDEVVHHGYIDVFRHFYPTKTGAYTYWDQKTGARERNVGWRIDYFFVSPDLQRRLAGIEILTDIYGSDHCPILLKLK